MCTDWNLDCPETGNRLLIITKWKKSYFSQIILAIELSNLTTLVIRKHRREKETNNRLCLVEFFFPARMMHNLMHKETQILDSFAWQPKNRFIE